MTNERKCDTDDWRHGLPTWYGQKLLGLYKKEVEILKWGAIGLWITLEPATFSAKKVKRSAKIICETHMPLSRFRGIRVAQGRRKYTRADCRRLSINLLETVMAPVGDMYQHPFRRPILFAS